MKRRIPRGLKILFCLLITAVSVFTVYAMRGQPNFSPEMAFRRWEQSQMVGPGELLADIEIDANYYDRLIVAKTEYNYELFGYSLEPIEAVYANCYAVTGDMVLYSVPPSGSLHPDTLILFDQNPQAVAAELEYSAEGIQFQARSERQWDEFFLFSFYSDGFEEEYELDTLADIAGDYCDDRTCIVTIRLYSAGGELLEDRELLVGNVQFG